MTFSFKGGKSHLGLFCFEKIDFSQRRKAKWAVRVTVVWFSTSYKNSKSCNPQHLEQQAETWERRDKDNTYSNWSKASKCFSFASPLSLTGVTDLTSKSSLKNYILLPFFFFFFNHSNTVFIWMSTMQSSYLISSKCLVNTMVLMWESFFVVVPL